MQELRKIGFGKWLLVCLVTYALFDVAFVGLAGLALNLSPRSLLLPYVMLFSCGLLLTVLLYWTRQSYDRPKSCATRLAFSIFTYLLIFMSVLIFSVVRIGILSQSTGLDAYAPYILPGSLIAAMVVYFMARTKLQARQKRDQLRTKDAAHRRL